MSAWLRGRALAACTGALLAAAAALGACGNDHAPHDHGEEHPAGHDHHEEGHGHGGGPVVKITLWSEHHELFAEHEAAVAGQPVELLTHLTVLDGFRALDAGPVALVLEGPAALRGEAAAPLRPGIFQLAVTPPQPGTYRGHVAVGGPGGDRIEGIEITVHASAEAAAAAASSEDDAGTIELLKEQQWSVPFATAAAAQGTLAATAEIAGEVTTPPGGSAEIGAPAAGRIAAPPGGLLRPGAKVKKGQLLATLAPAPASPEEAGRAGLAVAEAEARAAAARAALERAERLIRDEAIPQRQVEDARRELRVAEEAVRAARRARSLFSGAAGGTGAGSWRLVAPIAGTLVEARATPGASAQQGEVLFRILAGGELWLRGRVPEQDAPGLRADRDAAFQVTGMDRWMPIDVTGPDAAAEVVTVGRTVDPRTRTVEIIYALREPPPELRVGGLVRLAVPVGGDVSGVVVPRSAVTEVNGRPVVYVQVDGEHFAERGVRPVARAADRVVLESGLEPGERVVTTGAHIVRLAARAAGGEQPHGHIH